MNLKSPFGRIAGLAITAAVSATSLPIDAAFAARGNDTPGSDAGGGGCGCNDTPDRPSEPSDNSSSTLPTTCSGYVRIDTPNSGIVVVNGNGAIGQIGISYGDTVPAGKSSRKVPDAGSIFSVKAGNGLTFEECQKVITVKGIEASGLTNGYTGQVNVDNPFLAKDWGFGFGPK